MSVSIHRATRPSLIVAAAATLVAVQAQAAVITTIYNQPLSSNPDGTNPSSLAQSFDVNGDSVNDFTFTHSTAPVSSGGIPVTKTDYNGKLTIDSATAAQFAALVKDTDALNADGVTTNPVGNYAETLALGSVVGGSSTFLTLAGPSPLLDSSGTNNLGAFSVATGELTPSQLGTVFVGFQLGSGANAHYGYLEFANVYNDDNLTNDDVNDATLVGAAYETVAGAPITVVNLVPEPTSLAALAGVSTLALARKRRRRA